MIHDAKVEVTCDGKNCRESIFVDLEFVYPDYSGRGGRYDHSPAKINRAVRAEGWTVVEEGGDKHYCEGCTPEEE